MPIETLTLRPDDGGPVDADAITAHLEALRCAARIDGAWHVAASRRELEAIAAVSEHTGRPPASGLRLAIGADGLRVTDLEHDTGGATAARARLRPLIDALAAERRWQIEGDGRPLGATDDPALLDAVFGAAPTGEPHPPREPLEWGRLIIWSHLYAGERHAIALHDDGTFEYTDPRRRLAGRLDAAATARWRAAIDAADLDDPAEPDHPEPAAVVSLDLITPDDTAWMWFEIDDPPPSLTPLNTLAVAFVDACRAGQAPPGAEAG